MTAGVPAVMTAHLLVPLWDSRPATLSAVALQDWVRQRLGFKGVVITDDLEMGAIAGRMSVAQAAREALAAGADLLLICNNWQAAPDTVRLLAADATPYGSGPGKRRQTGKAAPEPCLRLPPVWLRCGSISG